MPGDNDTNIGGYRKWFPATTEGFVDALKGSQTRVQELGAQMLCDRYWKPVYHYLRTALARSNEDAKDLTQTFFTWLIERELQKKYDAAQGSFRGFLKGLLRNFLGNREQELRTLKRGGGVKIMPLETGDDALDRMPADPNADPETIFDQVWMNELVRRSVQRVRARCASGLRAMQFKAFEQYDLSAEPPTYAELATRLGVKESDVRNYLFAVRDLVREEVWTELSETSGSADRAQEEWNAFFNA